jgi:hypothetical protein
LGSPCKGDEFSTLDTKLARDEKFASEIFFPCNLNVFLLRRSGLPPIFRGAIKAEADQGLHFCVEARGDG